MEISESLFGANHTARLEVITARHRRRPEDEGLAFQPFQAHNIANKGCELIESILNSIADVDVRFLAYEGQV